MAKYKTMPCEIEAIQWTDNTTEIKEFCGDDCTYSVADAAWEVGKGKPIETLVIHTLEGDMVASRNDYIIKGLRGEFYPCKTDVFEKKYVLSGKQTNADRVRAMNNAELATFLAEFEICSVCKYLAGKCELDSGLICTKGFAAAMAQEWLQKEVEG